MSTKRKRRRRTDRHQRLARARIELSKGNAKAALKDAKVCFRDDPNSEHRELLERAYLGRVVQLRGLKRLEDARAALVELADLQPTTPEVCQQLARMRVLTGAFNEESASLLEADSSLLTQMADDWVLDPRSAAPGHSHVMAHAEQIRDALLAIEKEDDEAAAELVKMIPRNSPLCDWKLFARGLSAFYQADRQRTDENWRRLDRNRPAWCIAQSLLVAAGELSAGEAPPSAQASLHKLERHLHNDPADTILKQLATHWQLSSWKEYFRDYRLFCQRFAKSHSKLIAAVTELTWKRAVRERDEWMLDKIVDNGPAPSLDPHWNRARALMCEQVGEFDVSPVEDYWVDYAHDVATLAELREDERSIAAGLVYLHLARRLMSYGDDNEKSSLLISVDDEATEQLRAEAARFYRQSIASCGQLAAAYHELAQLHEETGEAEKSAAVLKKLIRQLPEDYEAHFGIANHYIRFSQPEKSETHVNVVVRLRPRDQRTVTLRWNQRLAMIRALVKQKQFEAARRELAEAEKNAPANIEPYTLDLLRAAIEFKAGNTEAAERFLQAGLDTVEEPTAVWVQMSLTAARNGLGAQLRKDFSDRYKTAIERKPSSETAGRLARLFVPLRANEIDYVGRATHERLYLKYLRRAKRTRWQEQDLCDVCNYLSQLPNQSDLLHRLITTGANRFPDCPLLQMLAGEREMAAGPSRCDFRKARRYFERALQKARESRRQENVSIVERAEQALILLDETQKRIPPFMFRGNLGDDDPFEPIGPCTDDFADEPAGGPLDGMDIPEVLETMQQMLPPFMMAQLERVADERGQNVGELFLEIVEKGPALLEPPIGESSETPDRHKRRRNK